MEDREQEREKLLYVELPNLVNRILHLSLVSFPTSQEILQKDMEQHLLE